MNRAKLYFAMLMSFTANHVFANDSTGYVGVGGLTYKKTADIEMTSEHLLINKDKIRVEYEFSNLTNHDVNETILFPLPVIKSQVDGDFANTQDLVKSFKVWGNNQPVTTQAHSSGFLKGQDITSSLQKCGFSEKEIGFAYYIGASQHALDDNADKVRSCLTPILAKRGLSLDEDSPLWDSQVTYSWTQTFPAHQNIRVRHEYTPLVGGSVALGLDYSDDVKKQFCLDRTFMSKLNKGGNSEASYNALGYVLKTGANWAKPIPHFTLTIDKAPNELLSLCWDASLKKISPTRFEAVKTNFTPTRDIDILFAIPYQN